jgi:hypothetical protein
MRACKELDRLAVARPRIVQRTEDVVGPAEAERLLRQILASAPAPGRARARTPGRGLPRPHRAGLLAGSLGLTAAAVAAALVLSSGTTPVPITSTRPVPSGPRATAPGVLPGRSAREILLAYATAAARAPATTGKYWYIHSTFLSGFPDTFDTWMLRNGANWVRAYKTHGRVIKLPWAGPGWDLEVSSLFAFPFRLGKPPAKASPKWPGQVTYGQLQRLPDTPAALKAWVVAFDRDFAESMGGTPVYPGAGVFMCLTNLIADLPAPALVRAAAFRVLATLPHIRRVDGGKGLLFGLGKHGYATLIVGPSTSALRDLLVVPGVNKRGRPLRLSVTARWVNRLPQVSHTGQEVHG